MGLSKYLSALHALRGIVMHDQAQPGLRHFADAVNL